MQLADVLDCEYCTSDCWESVPAGMADVTLEDIDRDGRPELECEPLDQHVDALYWSAGDA